jgi:hypothetical protein
VATSGLSGPYNLSEKEIDRLVGTGLGVYTLGQLTKEDNLFHISYMGRSDDNLNTSLRKYIGRYSQFEFCHYMTKKTAFEKECMLWHNLNPRNNKTHPKAPNKTDFTCPAPGCPH